MNSMCIFIKTIAKEGKREDLFALWEKHLKDRAESNPNQSVYFNCFDENDPNTILIFEYYNDREAFQRNAAAPWFMDYMKEAMSLIAGEPEVRFGRPKWKKVELNEA